ncbi:MAG: DUF1924 domain-containing protein [Sulfurovum sp.]|nr:DUF1924 domain-containing protein [Sulfurovum sp.]
MKIKSLAVLALVPFMLQGAEFNPQMQKYIESLKAEAKKADSNFVDFDAQRGERIFSSKHIGKRGKKISCTSCHGIDLTQEGKNIFTNKVLPPLAPSANSKSLTKTKNVKKWLRRNFKDVYKREGTALEKGDVLYYINSK